MVGNIRILLADDSEMLRRVVKNLLIAKSGDWVVCGEADNGEEALRQVAELLPDVILLDLSIPVLHGLTVAKTITSDFPQVKVILMSEQDASILSRLAEIGGTQYYVPKSRLALDLFPLLSSLANPSRQESGDPLE